MRKLLLLALLLLLCGCGRSREDNPSGEPPEHPGGPRVSAQSDRIGPGNGLSRAGIQLGGG